MRSKAGRGEEGDSGWEELRDVTPTLIRRRGAGARRQQFFDDEALAFCVPGMWPTSTPRVEKRRRCHGSKNWRTVPMVDGDCCRAGVFLLVRSGGGGGVQMAGPHAANVGRKTQRVVDDGVGALENVTLYIYIVSSLCVRFCSWHDMYSCICVVAFGVFCIVLPTSLGLFRKGAVTCDTMYLNVAKHSFLFLSWPAGRPWGVAAMLSVGWVGRRGVQEARF